MNKNKVIIPEVYQKTLERLAGFYLLDNYFMRKCFENNIACIELILQIILESDLKVESVRTENPLTNLHGHSGILDIFAVDTEGNQFNIEVEKDVERASVRRARYYNSLLDTRSLPAGFDWKYLPRTYVVFITKQDVWKKGLALYHIYRRLEETGEYCGDGTCFIYFNTACQDDTPLGRLAHDFQCRNPDEMYYPVLAERVRYFKEEKEGIMEFYEEADYWRNMGIELGRQEGRQEGKEETIFTIAQRMLEEKDPLDKIMRCTGLTQEELKKIQEPVPA